MNKTIVALSRGFGKSNLLVEDMKKLLEENTEEQIVFSTKVAIDDKEEEQRICTACGKVLASGYCINDGEDYYCSDKCLLTRYSEEVYRDLYQQDSAYWTEWE